MTKRKQADPEANKSPGIYLRGKTFKVVHSYRDPLTGKTRQLTGTAKTSREADALKAKLALDAKNGVAVGDGARVTVGELLDKWQALNANNWSPTNVRNTERMIRDYLAKRIGDVKLAKLRTRNLDALYLELREEGGKDGAPLAASTVHRVHSIVSSALAQAVRWELIDANPADKCTLPKKDRYRIVPPSMLEVIELVEEAAETDKMYATFLTLAFATGARRGELCALRWTDFDLKAGTVRIDRSIAMGKTGNVEKGTKTGVERVVTLDGDTIVVVRAHRALCAGRCLACGVPLPADGFLFSKEVDGSRCWRPDSATHHFTRLRDKLGLKVATP